MSKVLVVGSGSAIIVYALIGIFGYLTFVYTPQVLENQNILNAPYGRNPAIIIVILTFLTS